MLYIEKCPMERSCDSETEKERVDSPASSNTSSSYSTAEIHSAVELAAAATDEDGGDDGVWEQLGSLSSGNVNAVSLRGEDPVLTKQELIRQIHLRTHVNQLKSSLAGKEGKVEMLRQAVFTNFYIVSGPPLLPSQSITIVQTLSLSCYTATAIFFTLY